MVMKRVTTTLPASTRPSCYNKRPTLPRPPSQTVADDGVPDSPQDSVESFPRTTLRDGAWNKSDHVRALVTSGFTISVDITNRATKPTRFAFFIGENLNSACKQPTSFNMKSHETRHRLATKHLGHGSDGLSHRFNSTPYRELAPLFRLPHRVRHLALHSIYICIYLYTYVYTPIPHTPHSRR